MAMSAVVSGATDDIGTDRSDRCKAFAKPMTAVRDDGVMQMIRVRNASSDR